jgi:hypothetical protein
MRKSRETVQVSVPVLILRDGDSYVAYCPILELSAYGTSEEDAKAAFEDALRIFVSEALEKGTLDSELIRLGWSISKAPAPRYSPTVEYDVPFSPGMEIIRATSRPMLLPA